MALTLAARGIRVDALDPGAVETPLLLRQFEAGHGCPQDTPRTFAALHALKATAQPIELADPALFLACDESLFLGRTSLLANGRYNAS